MSTATQIQHYIFNQLLEVKNSTLTPETKYNYMIVHQCSHKALMNYNKGEKYFLHKASNKDHWKGERESRVLWEK